MKQHIAIGTSDFKDIRKNGSYFVDKSLFIKEIEECGKATLVTRPRRFGKTLALSMLRYFYEIGEDNGYLFEGLAIEKEEKAMSHQGKHPVIYLTLKEIKEKKWADAYTHLKRVLLFMIEPYLYLLKDKDCSIKFKETYNAIVKNKGTMSDYSDILLNLSSELVRFHKAQVVILIDEYDTPIQQAYLSGYYDEAISFFKTFLGSGLKDNVALERAVLTGISRVSREGLFSDLNNFTSYSILNSERFATSFGFTQAEVAQMLKDYDMNGNELSGIKSWYDGYLFGGITIYNPWSILYFMSNPKDGFKPYWVNTSDNALLRRFFFHGENNIKGQIEKLLRGEKLRIQIDEYLSFPRLDTTPSAIWNLLLFTGYLRVDNIAAHNGLSVEADVAITNKEVHFVYDSQIQNWIAQDMHYLDYIKMIEALTKGHLEPFELFFGDFLIKTVSFYDAAKNTTENFYHALLLGMLAMLNTQFIIKSNGESGYGRYDICMIPKDKTKMGVVIELKAPDKKRVTLRGALMEARKQMKLNKYDTELKAQGITQIFRLCIAIQGKDFMLSEVK